MSIKVMTDVWASKLYSSGTLLVLLAMADWANDEDLTCRPSVSALAKKARLTDRQVQRVLRKLEADGTITAVGTYPTRSGSPIAIYRINTDTLNGKGVKMSPFIATGKGDIGDGGRVTLATEKGDIGDAGRVTPVSPDPLLGDPLLDPSLGEGEAAVPPTPPEPPAPMADVVENSETATADPAVIASPPTQSPAPTVDQAIDGAPVPVDAAPTTTRAIVDQPPIAVYHEIFMSTPSRALMAQILKHGIDDLPRWSDAVTAWCRAGYNPRNIGGMLDWYDHPERIAGNSPPTARSGSPPMSKVERSLAAVDEVMAMLEKGGTL